MKLKVDKHSRVPTYAQIVERVKHLVATGELRPGDQVWLLPSHCCTTINLHDRYWCVRDGRLADTWPVSARGRFT